MQRLGVPLKEAWDYVAETSAHFADTTPDNKAKILHFASKMPKTRAPPRAWRWWASLTERTGPEGEQHYKQLQELYNKYGKNKDQNPWEIDKWVQKLAQGAASQGIPPDVIKALFKRHMGIREGLDPYTVVPPQSKRSRRERPPMEWNSMQSLIRRHINETPNRNDPFILVDALRAWKEADDNRSEEPSPDSKQLSDAESDSSYAEDPMAFELDLGPRSLYGRPKKEYFIDLT